MPISHAHLRSFHAVATHASFTRAAEILHITQPTLSGQVKELEERYGIKFLPVGTGKRTGRAIRDQVVHSPRAPYRAYRYR